jgi:predicted DNA-binding ribbon-helix-helix protein
MNEPKTGTCAGSAVRKWSAEINGNKSSVSLELEFYVALCEIARARRVTTQALIGEIAEHNPQRNLSSELRLTVLRWLQSRAKPPAHSD